MLKAVRLEKSALLALPAAALLALCAMPAAASTVMFTSTPTLNSSGAGVLDLSSALGLTTGQTANFSSATATFSFTAPNLDTYTGTTSVYAGTTYYDGGCSGCSSYSYAYYADYQNYAPVLSTASVNVGSQGSSATSTSVLEQTYLGTYSGGTFPDYNNHYVYQDAFNTGGPLSITLNLNQQGLAALDATNSLAFTLGFSNPSIAFNNVSFQGEYSVVDPVSSTPISAVPEPATWATMVLGFLMTGVCYRISRRRNAGLTAFAS